MSESVTLLSKKDGSGSLHFVGEAMEELGLLPASVGERALNEWDASGRATESTVRVA